MQTSFYKIMMDWKKIVLDRHYFNILGFIFSKQFWFLFYLHKWVGAALLKILCHWLYVLFTDMDLIIRHKKAL